MDNLYNLKENKLIGQGLEDIKTKRNSHNVMCIMQIGYPCLVFSFHSQHILKVRNRIRKHL